MASSAEQTRPGVVFTPDVDIFENERQITLLADMPGVASDDTTIDVNGNVLSITGEVKPVKSENESDVILEFESGCFHRQFTLSEVIDLTKIEAKQEDGVLRLNLPKAEKTIPRQITVTAG